MIMSTAAARDPLFQHRKSKYHKAKTRYLQCIFVSFLVVSAALLLYTTLISDPIAEFERNRLATRPLPATLKTLTGGSIGVQLVRVNGLDLIPLSQIVVQDKGERHDEETPAERDPPTQFLRKDAQPSSSAIAQEEFQSVAAVEQSEVSRSLIQAKPAGRKLAHDASPEQSRQQSWNNLADPKTILKHQIQFTHRIYIATGFLVAAVSVSVVIITRLLVDEGGATAPQRSFWYRRDNALSPLSEARSLIMSYGSFGSTDHISDWSGDYFDRFDV
jgi:hypothetical protein